MHFLCLIDDSACLLHKRCRYIFCLFSFALSYNLLGQTLQTVAHSENRPWWCFSKHQLLSDHYQSLESSRWEFKWDNVFCLTFNLFRLLRSNSVTLCHSLGKKDVPSATTLEIKMLFTPKWMRNATVLLGTRATPLLKTDCNISL